MKSFKVWFIKNIMSYVILLIFQYFNSFDIINFKITKMKNIQQHLLVAAMLLGFAVAGIKEDIEKAKNESTLHKFLEGQMKLLQEILNQSK